MLCVFCVSPQAAVLAGRVRGRHATWILVRLEGRLVRSSGLEAGVQRAGEILVPSTLCSGWLALLKAGDQRWFGFGTDGMVVGERVN